MTTEQSPGGAEDPITLTSLNDLLHRYKTEVDDLRKELADTKASMGGEIAGLQGKVKELEAQVDLNKKRKFFF